MSAGGAAAVLPQRLGRYEVRALLGRGAMGSVYKARDPALDREVAVKTLGGLLLESPELREEYLERFRREARAAARLSHPNIVAVHDFGVDEATGTPFIVMEYVPGVSLSALLRETPVLPVDQALAIADQVAAALEEAHGHGIVHRDVKPANVFVDPRGRVKVGDFGIARMEGSELTQAGVLLGTPGYLAPEVVRGAPADAKADVFALGALAYALLSGRKPYLGVTPQALAAEVLERDPEPPHLVRPEVPVAVSEAVVRALARSPEARTPTVATFRQELTGSRGEPAPASDLPATAWGGQPTERVSTAAPNEVPPTMTVASAAAAGRRFPRAAVAAAVALAALLIVAWLAGSRGARTASTPSAPAAAAPARSTAAPSATPMRARPAPVQARPAPPRAAPPAVIVIRPAPPEEAPPGRSERRVPGKGRGHGRGHAKGKKGK